MTTFSSQPEQRRHPALFLGHGSPMNAIEDNEWSRAFKALGRQLRRPRAILSISAHWYVPGIYVTADEHPRTIHDFSGFPRELYEVQYPAPGDPDLARKVVDLLGAETASLSEEWGLDHGTWSVLTHLFPAADVPVVQLSLDSRLALADHLELARKLCPLRDEGVLILGSGNLVHNLRDAFSRMSRGDRTTPTWATEFDATVSAALDARDGEALVKAIATENGRLAHPTLDHYLPVLYVMGCVAPGDELSFPITGFDLGSLSMRAACFA